MISLQILEMLCKILQISAMLCMGVYIPSHAKICRNVLICAIVQSCLLVFKYVKSSSCKTDQRFAKFLKFHRDLKNYADSVREVQALAKFCKVLKKCDFF